MGNEGSTGPSAPPPPPPPYSIKTTQSYLDSGVSPFLTPSYSYRNSSNNRINFSGARSAALFRSSEANGGLPGGNSDHIHISSAPNTMTHEPVPILDTPHIEPISRTSVGGSSYGSFSSYRAADSSLSRATAVTREQLDKRNRQTHSQSGSQERPEEISVSQGNQVVHRLQSGDTLEGLAIKYGTSVADIKRANKLWSANEMFTRKSLVIPVDPDSFFREQLEQHSLDQLDRVRAAIDSFMEITKCPDQTVARRFLEANNMHIQEAIQSYLSSQPSNITSDHQTVSQHVPDSQRLVRSEVDSDTKKKLEATDQTFYEL